MKNNIKENFDENEMRLLIRSLDPCDNLVNLEDGINEISNKFKVKGWKRLKKEGKNVFIWFCNNYF